MTRTPKTRSRPPARGCCAGHRLPVLCLLAALTACQHSPAAEVPGCYQLTQGAWHPDLPHPTDAPLYAPPPQFRLRQEPDTSRRRDRGFRMAEPPIAAALGERPWAGWRLRSPTEVEIVWSDGYTGALLLLEPRGDSLVGTAEAMSDGGWPGGTPTATAVARRVACADDTRSPPRP